MTADIDTLLRKAARHERRGVPEDAMMCYHQILTVHPANRRAREAAARVAARHAAPPPTALRAARAAQAAGAAETALATCLELAAHFPFHEPVWSCMGAAAQAMRRHDMALRAFSQAVRLAPHLARTHGNLGATLLDAGDPAAAAESFLRATAIAPGDLQLHLNAGKALTLSDAPEAALAAFEAAFGIAPDDPRVRMNLGTTHLTMGRLPDAREHLEAAVAADPDCVKALNNLASVQLALSQTDAAIETAKRAVARDPEHANAHHTLANALQDAGHLRHAVRSYERALHLAPEMHFAQAHLFHFQSRICDWRARDQFASVASVLGIEGEMVSPWALLAMEDHPARQLARARRYAAQWTAAAPASGRGARKERLRIGYFSSDLYDHATLFLLTGVLEQHDTAAIDLRIYSLNPPRDSRCRDRLIARADAFQDLHMASDSEIAAQARRDDLDIAIDLKGYTHGARNGPFFARMAPVQVNYLGYPGSLGAAAYDYIIADDMVIPAAQRPHYDEHVIHMPHSYQPNDSRRPIAADTPERADCGLPEQAIVLCCFNASYKIGPEEFDIWMRVLQRVPAAVLWLLDGGEPARGNLRAAARTRGVDPARLVFAGRLPHAAHLARHRLADLFVDTFNVNAHTTASDALYAGLPVLTCPGAQFAARVGASLCRAVGLDDMITADRAAYEARLLSLAQDPAALRAHRARLTAAVPTAPLFDTAAYTRHLETGLRMAWERWHSGAPACDLRVPADTAKIRHAG